MQRPDIVLWGIVLFLVFLSITFVFLGQRRRARAAKKFAETKGWTYTANDKTLPPLFQGRTLNPGSSKRTLNVVRGRHRTRQAFSADYVYDTEKTDDDGRTRTKAHYMQVSGVELARPIHRIVVVPRGAFGRAPSKVADPNLSTGDPEFDKAFEIELADPKAAEQLLTASVRRYCLENLKYPFAVRGKWAITWRKGKRKLKTVEKELDYLDGLVQRLPAYSDRKSGRKKRGSR